MDVIPRQVKGECLPLETRVRNEAEGIKTLIHSLYKMCLDAHQELVLKFKPNKTQPLFIESIGIANANAKDVIKKTGDLL